MAMYLFVSTWQFFGASNLKKSRAKKKKQKKKTLFSMKELNLSI
jgi:hypothetical protein